MTLLQQTHHYIYFDYTSEDCGFQQLLLYVNDICVCLHFNWVCMLYTSSGSYTYPPAPTCVFTPSLARLRASGAGRKRVGTRLTGWHLSPGEQGKEGKQRETSACSIRKSPGGDSTHRFQLAKEQLTAGSCRQTAWLPGICTDWQKMHHTGRCTYMCTHLNV